MAFSLTAGTNVAVSAATSGAYAYFTRPKTQGMDGHQKWSGGVTFMIKDVGASSGGGTITLAAVWKDTLVSAEYHLLTENVGGAVTQWSRTIANPGNSTTAYYGVSIPFPKNANVVGFTVTGAGDNAITVSAKENVVGV